MSSMELCNLHFSPNIIRGISQQKIGQEGHVTCMGEIRNEYKIFYGKTE